MKLLFRASQIFSAIHQNCVAADDLYFLPRDNNIISPSEQAEKSEPSVNYQAADCRRFDYYVRVADLAELCSGVDIYNFLADYFA